MENTLRSQKNSLNGLFFAENNCNLILAGPDIEVLDQLAVRVSIVYNQGNIYRGGGYVLYGGRVGGSKCLRYGYVGVRIPGSTDKRNLGPT